MPITTETATHVYVKKDNPKGLLQTYTGPHPIVERPSHSTVKVKMGTFKSGVENVQLHHWSSCKPAQMRPDAREAEMVKRGRPSKEPSGPANVSNQTEQAKQPQPVAVKSKQRPAAAKPQPVATRRSERIASKNHETSTSVGHEPAPHKPEREPTPPTVVAADAVSQPSAAWSATAQDIAAINAAISSRHSAYMIS